MPMTDSDTRAIVDPGLGAKVAFLSRPESYPEPTTSVATVETHLSWVFLTDRNAWKLKKPVHTRYVDFRTVAARRTNCDEEMRLNRRLSDGVYLDVVPLALDCGDRLCLGQDGDTIDWLVKMRRLPAERMLDAMIRTGRATHADVATVVARLARFYRGSAPVPMTGERYRATFAEGIAENLRELAAPAYGLPAPSIAAVCFGQQDILARHARRFDERVEAGRIIEAHGDLRPEHICLETPPQIIDCLEFSRELRLLDPADELAFLALECERLGAAALAAAIAETYREVTLDAPPAALLAFYRSYRACVRAKIAMRHLADDAPREPSKWVAQARVYLALSGRHLARARGDDDPQASSSSTMEPPP